MASRAVNKYIGERYGYWLDYAKFHCIQAGIEDEAYDVLNEVLEMLLKKELDKLDKLLQSKHGKYSELDFFVLRMIKLNIKSPTSPYQYKYHKPYPIDTNIDIYSLDIAGETPVDSEAYSRERSEEISDALLDWLFRKKK